MSENKCHRSNRKNMISVVRGKLGEIRRKVFRTNDAYWYCKNLSSDFHVHVGNIPDLKTECDNNAKTIQWIQKNSLAFPWIFNDKEVEYARKYNHIYSSLLLDGNIVGYVKVAFVKAYIEDYENDITLNHDEAFIIEAFILPEFRNKNLGSFMLSSIFNKLKSRGIEFVFCHIPDWNKASDKMCKNIGFKRIAHVRYVRLSSFRYFSHEPEAVKERGRKLFEADCNDVTAQNT